MKKVKQSNKQINKQAFKGGTASQTKNEHVLCYFSNQYAFEVNDKYYDTNCLRKIFTKILVGHEVFELLIKMIYDCTFQSMTRKPLGL